MSHSKGHWNRGTAILAAGVLLFSAGRADAQNLLRLFSASQPTTAPKDDVGGAKAKTTRPGAFDVDFQDTDVRTAFRLLSTQGNKNIVTTKDVSGKVTAVLYDVTFQEALDAVCRATGYVYIEKGSLIQVMTAKQKEDIEKAERQLKVETFKLSYLTAADAKTLVTPMLSSEGTISTTPAAVVGIPENKVASGGNVHATDDVIIVRDYEDRLQRMREVLRDLDVKPEQVLIEATILKCKLTEDTSLGINFNVLSGIRLDKVGDIDTIKTNFTFTPADAGITISFTSQELTMLLRALEGVTDFTILANPKLLVVNKQRGEVMVGNREGYLTTTITETVATQTVQFLETGTRLVVRPFVARDGYVRLEIHPEDSSGSVRPVGNAVLPTETTTEVTTTVLVRDGHTIIIGGLFREESKSSHTQIPLAGSIPYLGALFRQTTDNTVRDEVIILITPRIIKQPVDEAVSEQLKDDVERFRIGARKGLMWIDHDKMAQTCMRVAKFWLAEGKHDLALWNVELAMGIQPRSEEAIRLRERLTGRTFWANQPQESSVRYVIQRMVMQEMGKPVERIIPSEKPRDAEAVDPEVRSGLGIDKRPEDPFPRTKLKRTVKPKPMAAPAEPAVGKMPATQPAR